jgi:hypothetical protein
LPAGGCAATDVASSRSELAKRIFFMRVFLEGMTRRVDGWMRLYNQRRTDEPARHDDEMFVVAVAELGHDRGWG